MDSSRRRRNILVVIALVIAFALVGTWAARTQQHRTATAPTVVQRGCPAVIPGTSNAADDFADMFSWGRTFFVRQGFRAGDRPQSAALTDRIGAIACSLSDPQSTGGMRIAPGDWPDGVATGLATGTTIYRVDGHDPTCLLGVRVGATVVTYSAWDFKTNSAPC